MSTKDEGMAVSPNGQQTDVTSSSGFTWNDLAEAISKLPAEQRKKQVNISIEDESIFRKVEGLEQIPEDVYVNNDNDEDCGSLEDLKEAWGEDFKQEDYRLATPKGTPFLWDGF